MQNFEFLRFYTDTPKNTHAPGLGVMLKLMARLGDPQKSLACVHIAGTNGKGSCAAAIASMLRAAGYKTGLFTSPDLTGLWERISIDGVYITLSDLQAVTDEVRTACEGLSEPSFFEKITAAAFLYFARSGCERVVLETGLGGRLDATNIIENPLCSVIMPIGLEHTAVLGDTLAAIAAEKAGIIKPGRPVIAASQSPEAMGVIRQVCREKGTALHEVDITNLSPVSNSLSGQVFSYKGLENITLSLLGAHQAENACAAIETAQVLALSESAVRAGLKAVRWPCRFEVFPKNPPIVLDGAHNAHGAAALAAALREYFAAKRFTMLVGVMADKDYRQMLRVMESLAARFICLTPESSRALPAEELAAEIDAVPALTAASPAEALALAAGFDEPICAFGSLYYIGTLRKHITGEDS